MPAASQPYHLTSVAPGLLENLRLEPLRRRPPAPGEVEIRVRATGLNFRDVLHALGMLDDRGDGAGVPFGFECAGEVVALGDGVETLATGDAVLAAPTVGGFASFVTVRREFVVRTPPGVGHAAAASVPIAYLTARYALDLLAGLRAGERVLVHCAAGGVGHAAVRLAQAAGVEVFATAHPTKWEHLGRQGVRHVMSSRTLEFADQVRAETGGRGVDVVLNSLTGRYIDRSLDALVRGGRFIEMGKIGIWDADRMRAARPDVRYAPFDLGEVARDRPAVVTELLRELASALAGGTFAPLPSTVFPIEDVVSAFRFVAKAKHVGKVVVAHDGMAS